MTLNELSQLAHENAKEKGWWDEDRSPLEIHALIHSEISEATEEVRDGMPSFYMSSMGDNPIEKPEGEAIELVDAIIRIADYFAKNGWELEYYVKKKMQYNKTRAYRHGNKKY